MTIHIRPTRSTITVADGTENTYEVSVEECPADAAEQWSLYERRADGSAACLCDCPDFATATRVRDALTAATLPASRPIHCPTCATERGVAIPASCPHIRPSFTIPDHVLEPADTTSSSDRDERLAGVISINDCPMHIEAIPVSINDDGAQTGTDPTSASRLDALCDELGVYGFATTTINDKDYVLVITPVGL